MTELKRLSDCFPTGTFTGFLASMTDAPWASGDYAASSDDIDRLDVLYVFQHSGDKYVVPLMKMFLENRKMKKIWMEKPTGTLYPMTQVPPGKHFLPQFAWFDYVRPLDKDDIFNWRPKKAGTELKEIKRREPPKNTKKQ